MKKENYNQAIECDVKSCKHLLQNSNRCALNSIKVSSKLLNDSKTYCENYKKTY